MAGFKQALEDSKVTKAAVKKVTVPVLQDIPTNVVEAAGKFLQKTREKKALEADLALLGEEVSSYVQTVQDAKAFKGQFANSYKVPTSNGDLTITTKNVFKINADDSDMLKDMFGSQYENLIQEKFEVVLKPEVLEDEKLQDELMAALGPDGFKKFFNTFTSLKVKDTFDERVYEFAKTFPHKEEKLAEIRTLVQPSKATLK